MGPKNVQSCAGINPFPPPGICMRRPSEPSMPAAAVGGAPGVVRTRPRAPQDRQKVNKWYKVKKSPFSHHVGPKLSHARSMADSLPWPFPSGKPCHQFVGCGCRAGPRMPTYSRRHSRSAVEWLRCPVRSNEPSILTVAVGPITRRRVKRRDRKVARVASRCMGSTTGMVRVAAMVDTTSDSPRLWSTHHLRGCF